MLHTAMYNVLTTQLGCLFSLIADCSDWQCNNGITRLTPVQQENNNKQLDQNNFASEIP